MHITYIYIHIHMCAYRKSCVIYYTIIHKYTYVYMHIYIYSVRRARVPGFVNSDTRRGRSPLPGPGQAASSGGFRRHGSGEAAASLCKE